MRALLIGNASGRLSCTAQALRENTRSIDNPMRFVEILTNYRNPQLDVAGNVRIGNITDPEHITQWLNQLDRATDLKNDIAVISDEAPLAAGIADLFLAKGIPTFGPIKRMTIEASKIQTRELMESCGLVAYNPLWRAFGAGRTENVEHMATWIDDLNGCAIKPDGLTGGKGVQVQGEHFHSTNEGIRYCRTLMKIGGIIIEAKHVGEEFSLQTLSDGTVIIDLPPVFDCKRLEPGDTGPNTGGMGSWCSTTELPSWLTPELLAKASEINRTIIETLQERMAAPYRGVLYGNYMVCKEGLILIEFNCRFGDPEIMNIVPLLETSFSDIITATATGTLTAGMVRFRQGASVVKYLVPIGYPTKPESSPVHTGHVKYADGLHFYKASLIRHVVGEDTTWFTTGSRAVAVVGVGDTINEAEKIAESGARQIVSHQADWGGKLIHRYDIATPGFLAQRQARMEKIMAGAA